MITFLLSIPITLLLVRQIIYTSQGLTTLEIFLNKINPNRNQINLPDKVYLKVIIAKNDELSSIK